MLKESCFRNFEKTNRQSLKQKKILREDAKTNIFQQVVYLSLSRMVKKVVKMF